MIDESDWINLPVGYNLAEQMNVSTLCLPIIRVNAFVMLINIYRPTQSSLTQT